LKDLNLKLIERMGQLQIKKEGQNAKVFDPIRQKHVLFGPEEMVRQLFVMYLLEFCKIPRSRIAVERSIQVDKLTKRFDVLIFDKKLQASMIVECKNSKVEIDQKVLDQAGQYNRVIRAPYLLVTNGRSTYAFELDFETKNFTPLSAFPKL